MSGARRRAPFTVKMVTWLLASLSLLKLVEDITPIELYGIIKRWAEAYALFVDKVLWPIVGWIKFGQIEIEPPEQHALVLCMIIGSAAGRASYYYEYSENEDSSIVLHTIYVVSGWLTFSLFALLLMPSDASLSFVLPPMGVLFLQFMLQGEEGFLVPEDFRYEMLAVFATFLIIIIANYVIANL